MASGEVKHKLVAILSADPAGYRRPMGEDEEATVRPLGASPGFDTDDSDTVEKSMNHRGRRDAGGCDGASP